MPAILGLLADGVPRSRRASLAALADRHLREGMRRAFVRLTVAAQLVEDEGRYTVPRHEASGG